MRWDLVRAVFGLFVLLAAPDARADPEGYRGGEGRAPGTPYVSAGLSITVRSAVVRSADKWACDGRAAPGRNVVTVLLAISNPTAEPLSTNLPSMDLVVKLAGGAVRVEEGACVRKGHADVSIGAHRTQTIAVQFLVPRRATARILVYNDDDFPALFALPAAKTQAR